MREPNHSEPRTAPTRTQQRELSALPARLLPKLPLRARFYVYMPGIPKDVAFVTHELAEPRAAGPEVLFDGIELQAIIEAACSDRMWSTDFLELCIRKWNDPTFRVDRTVALQGACGLEERAANAGSDSVELTELTELTVKGLLQRLGATLIGLRLDEATAEDLGLAA